MSDPAFAQGGPTFEGLNEAPHMTLWCFCQHGPRECEKNALQACVMSYLPEPEDHMELINCIQGGAAFNDSVASCISNGALKNRATTDQ
ncbi:hypothetical protein TELCIR_00663 [Teladorsagia circumcincta]|uniref:Uncharacterized protein n=1 Tax=Teladorsagia circumcincta TaxID=45464 RepID=A0A2G9V422_TELCI|nr:hypothetical protein TELCIR_00663 [Teladorsagia circumcincta]